MAPPTQSPSPATTSSSSHCSTIEAWHDFYLLVGPSAAALIGLLFVVETLTAGFEKQRAIEGADVFGSPTVFHLAVVVLLSGMALAPDTPIWLFEIAVLGCGLAGLVYAVYVGVGLQSEKINSYASDFWWHAIAVGLLHGGLVTTGGPFWIAPAAAPRALASDLLLCCFRWFTIRGIWSPGWRRAPTKRTRRRSDFALTRLRDRPASAGKRLPARAPAA